MNTKCPLCGNDNSCGNAAGKPHGTCWCDRANFPREIFDKLPEKDIPFSERSCICMDCLKKLTADLKTVEE